MFAFNYQYITNRKTLLKDWQHALYICAVQEIIKKWKYLRTQFADELKREKNLKSGMSTDNVYVSHWRWRHALNFLADHIITRPATTVTNLNNDKVCLLIVVCSQCLYVCFMITVTGVNGLFNGKLPNPNFRQVPEI